MSVRPNGCGWLKPMTFSSVTLLTKPARRGLIERDCENAWLSGGTAQAGLLARAGLTD